MESHPLTKVVVGLAGLGLIVGVVWFGRSGGKLPVDDPAANPPANSDESAAEHEHGEEFTRPPISPTGPYPQAVVEESEHNFGVMEVRGEKSHAFTVYNRGEAPLVLAKGPSGCKCTISELATNEIPPDGSATINLTWKPVIPADEFRKTAIIYTNDPEMTDLELVIAGRVSQTITIRPQGVWRVDDLSKSEEKLVVGYIFSEVLESFEFETPESPSDTIVIDVLPMTLVSLEQEQAKSGYRINVTVKPDSTVGTFREQLTFNYKSPKLPPIKIFVEGRRSGPISFVSSGRTLWSERRMAIGLGEFDADKGGSGVLLLSVRGQEEGDLEILSVEAQPRHLQVSLEPFNRKLKARGRKMYKLKFAVPPGQIVETRIGLNAARVLLKTNHPEAAELRFRVSYSSH